MAPGYSTRSLRGIVKLRRRSAERVKSQNEPCSGLTPLLGTINVPSWSPDSRQVAFVSYELLRAK
ncbi:hypothetical protein SBV1_1850004 [Verrucomicrobia bacterium]|nr:hypothetical protein SBV1_1850004 [Verrucomicrobiota bacterium]